MHVLLDILLVIGILFGVIIGVLAASCLLVLFVPIRYAVEAEFDNDITAGLRIRWLMGFICFRMEYPGGNVRLRILGIPLGAGKKKSRRVKKAEKKGSKPGQIKKSVSAGKDEKKDAVSESGKAGEKSITVNDMEDDAAADGTKSEGPKGNKSAGDDGKTNKNRNKNGNMNKNKSGGSVSGIKQIGKRIISTIKELKKEENKRAFSFIKDIFIKMLKKFKPRKIRADMLIGLSDPANTGLLFGGLGIVTTFWKGRYHLVPDFENKVVQGNVQVKGYIMNVFVLYYVIKVIRNDDVRRMIKKGLV